jgi:hypothetical protein
MEAVERKNDGPIAKLDEETDSRFEEEETTIQLKGSLSELKDTLRQLKLKWEEEREPGFEDWFGESGKYEEETYWCGKSTITGRNMARPKNIEEQGPRMIRPSEEFPGLNQVLGKKGILEKDVPYPKLSPRETRLLINWCDSQPGNNQGKQRFLFYGTPRGTLAVTKIADKLVAKQRFESRRVLGVSDRLSYTARKYPARRRAANEQHVLG